jgi:UDP-glucose 4-epimerase
MSVVLVTGGAGYVGSHCCLALSDAGHEVVVFDNLSNGHRAFVRWGPLVEGDIRDAAALQNVFKRYRPEIVIHCAALIEVGESVRDPARFYDNNVRGALNVLDAMADSDTKAFVFSSTCATYGAPQRMPLTEDHPQHPLNPYGRTKLMIEQASRDYAASYGIKYAHLRYFNAAGAAFERGVGERHDPETHAIPLALLTALGKRERFDVYGDDYDTRDGTCVRDYVHVRDLADAHVRAAEQIASGAESLAINLGTGDGVTVLELLAAIERVTGKRLPSSVVERRPGDAAALVADNSYARTRLGWAPSRSLDDIVSSAWAWHSAHA